MNHSLFTTDGQPMTDSQTIAMLQTCPKTYATFCSFPQKLQHDFLDFCAGRTGIYICYDVFFKRIFNPVFHRGRLEKLLGALLKQKITILEVIPNEGFRMSDRGSFVLMDVLVRLSDSSIINLEIQKLGYLFPGKRADCYCADLILREYNRIHAESRTGEAFSYDKLSPVVNIVLMDKSPAAFHNFPHTYVHQVSMKSDTGIELDNLAKHIYVPLDIFHSVMHNKIIESEQEAWLTLLTTRDPSRIEELMQKSPEYAAIYKEIFEFRTKPEELINMYSEVLAEFDRNTEKLMIDLMKQEKEELKQETEELKQEKEELKQEVQKAKQEAESAKQRASQELAEKDALIAELQRQLGKKEN